LADVWKVRSRSTGGHFRAGVYWPNAFTRFDAEDKPEALKKLQADPRLDVRRLSKKKGESLEELEDVQPGNVPVEEPQAWADPDMERRRQEVLAAEAAASEAADERSVDRRDLNDEDPSIRRVPVTPKS